MSEPTLAKRMDKLEVEVRAIASDLTEVKHGVKQLTNALAGDGIQAGVIADFKHQIVRNASDIHELNIAIQRLHSSMLTHDQITDVLNIVSWFKGWKLVFVSLLALTPSATIIYNALKP